ncbi:MAG TPA: ATP-binding protein [Candidatus Obscuribacterales bacterium]
MKLLHKGIVLILVPLLVSVALIFYVYKLTVDADLQVQRQLRSAEVLAAADEFTLGNIISDLTTLTYCAYHQDSSATNNQLGSRRMIKALHELADLLRDRPVAFEELRTQVRRVMKSLEDHQRLMSLPQSMSLSVVRSMPKDQVMIKMKAMSVEDELTSLVVEDKSIVSDADDKGRLIWQQIQIILIGGLFGSLVVTAGLGRFFYRNILERLRNIQQNIRRMDGKGMLFEPVGGSDEIAQLDSAVHETALKLRELERYKARMIGFIGQQLCEPLQSIDATIQNLNQYSADDSAKKLMESSGRSMSRLTRLADELLNLPSLGEAKLQLVFAPVTVASLVQRSCEAVESMARHKQVTVKTRLHDAQIDVDADRVIQVLVNLLSNAIKFSPAGSPIILATDMLGDRVRFQVIDKGRGIPKEFQEKLFAKYVQVSQADSQNFKGFGLGLSICKSIVEEHGGTITFESEVGQGTTFTVEMPCEQRQHAGLLTMEEKRSRSGPLAWFVRDARIWQKGLIVVLFPVLFQIIFIGWSGAVLWNQDQLVEKAGLTHKVSGASIQTTQAAMHVVIAACLYHVTGFEFLQSEFQKDKDDLAVHLTTLRKLVVSGGEEAKSTQLAVDQIERGANSALAIAVKLMRGTSSELNATDLFTDAKESLVMENSLMGAVDLLDVLRVGEKALQQLQAQQSSQARTDIGRLAVVALGANVCLAGILLVLMWKGLSVRISEVIANTHNLVDGKPIASAGSGVDEIADIGRAFCDTADRISRLQEFKQQLVSVVGHDLRTPLTAVAGTFELLSEGMGGLPPEAVALAKKGEQESQNLIALINNLLDVERSKAGSRQQ